MTERYLAKLDLFQWRLRLYWNGAAMIDWEKSGLSGDAVFNDRDPVAIGTMLYLLAREGAGLCRYAGYPAPDVPEQEAILDFMRVVATPNEFTQVVEAIAKAIEAGSTHDTFNPMEDDYDTIQLKKN